MDIARKVIAIFLASSLSLVLVYAFVRMVKPASANEVERACGALQSAPRTKTMQVSGTSQAPDFTATDASGKQVKLSDFRGRVVMVNFWASWCKTCAAEKPSLEHLQDEMGDDLVVLALASDATWGPIRERVPESSSLRVLLDKPKEDGTYGPVATAWGIKAVPESFVVDRKGTLRHYFINKRDWDSSIATTCLQSIIDE